jgi:hypothetical protein
LSVTEPQRLAHHCEGGVGVQHDWLEVHTPPLGHVAGQAIA